MLTRAVVLISLFWLWSLTLVVIDPNWLISWLQTALFGATTALFTFWLLDALDYFGSFYPLPRIDSLFTLAIVVPASGILSKYVLLTAFGVVFLRYRDIVLATPAIVFGVYVIQWITGQQIQLSGFRRKICFFTTPDEAELVLKALRSRLLLKYYDPIFESDLEKLAPGAELTCVVISRSELHRFEKRETIITAMLEGENIQDHRDLIADLRGHLNLDKLDLWMFLYQSAHRGVSDRIYHMFKSGLERALSLIALVALLPLFALVGLVSKISTPGPVFFGQTRLGYRGVPFKLWKFRSMRMDAEKLGPKLSKMGDSRITPFGNFLRKTRIDELPQLWNVIRGEMSLIGPRPERPEFYDELEKVIPNFRFRLLVPPGITGWAQVMGGYAASTAQMKRKLEYDLYYLQRMSPKMDAWIAIRTISVAVSSLFRSSAK